MSNKMIKIFLCVAVTVLLTSCAGTMVEENLPTSNQVVETETPSIALAAQTLTSNVNYLGECKFINSSKLKVQISFQNIWPGTTKESEIEALMGAPDTTYIIKGVTNLVYGDIGLLVEDHIVTYVLAPIDENSGLTLRQVVLTYGCPDIIFAINTTEDQTGYAGTLFIYHNIGIEFSFLNYPATLSELPDNASYFQPMSFQEYLQESSWNVIGIPFGKPVEWNEAVNMEQ